ncbi:MAG: pilus assembly protein [Firmicutes bacterium]|nr:pilus assembly protein [Bacillota bacterium]
MPFENKARLRFWRFFIRNEGGQALVEMAIVMTVLLLLLTGIVEFGRIFNASLTVVHASREAARVGILGKTDEEIINAAKSASGFLDPTKLTISIVPSEGERKSGQELTVEVQYPVHIIVPLINHIIPNPFLVSGRTTMRIE